jgi:hypothetical protein
VAKLAPCLTLALILCAVMASAAHAAGAVYVALDDSYTSESATCNITSG